MVLLTSTKRRHRYVAAQLSETVNLVGILSEEKVQQTGASATESTRFRSSDVPGRDASDEKTDEEVVREHFARRGAAEARHLGTARFPDGRVPRIERPYGGANDADVFDWVQERSPEAIVLYGTSIIKPPLLGAYEGRMVNLHLGLSPYYRGSGTNFWPLVEGKPECVGATLHVAIEEVDAGGILAQVRPEVEAHDRAHDLGAKTIAAATALLPDVLRAYVAGRIRGEGQDLSDGRVYRRGDFHAGAVREMRARFDAGMMEDYLADIDRRCARYPIVQPAALSSTALR